MQSSLLFVDDKGPANKALNCGEDLSICSPALILQVGKWKSSDFEKIGTVIIVLEKKAD